MSRLSQQSPDSIFILVAAVVTRIEQVSPSYRRFTFTGPEVQHIADNRHDQRIKLLFPLPETGFDGLPMHDDWYQAWRLLPTPERHAMRTYTIREVRQDVAEFDIDIALHGRVGPASTWALDARIGDELIVNVPNARAAVTAGGVDWHAPESVDQVLLAGDETALPAIAGILESLPDTSRGIAVVEIPHPDDIAVLSTKPDGVELVVLPRGDQPVGTLLIPEVERIASRLAPTVDTAAIATLPTLEDVDIDRELLWEVPVDEHGGPVLASAPLYAWLAGEASAIKTLRRHLVSGCGVDRKSVAFMGYWRYGKSEDNG
ncbi:siderophore-interacting protein [Plantibacter flavus]|uniref:siderophore-interacting protein n=1 Tax=Plantibacter flavus TaxID=150123 RepID=UPI003F179547